MLPYTETGFLGSKFNHKCPYKRDAETDVKQRRRQCDRGGRDLSDVAKSQGMVAVIRS